MFNLDFEPCYGELITLDADLRRMTVNNPSHFTFKGTNTFVVGEGEVAVIDPGPDDPVHIDALLRALGDEQITHIVVTHTHQDHSPGCRELQQRTGAKTYGLGAFGTGAVERFNADDTMGGDLEFVPDVHLQDGEVLQGKNWSLECMHTPGHTANHMCYAIVGTPHLIAGDHVMGWSTSIVSPPDGNMGQYMRSLQRMLERAESLYHCAHGAPVEDPKRYVRALLAHRLEREQQVMNSIDAGCSSIDDMVAHVYSDLQPALHVAAARSLVATLDHLVEKGELQRRGSSEASHRWSRT